MEPFSAKERAVAIDKARGDFYFYVRWMMREVRGVRWQRAAHHPLICAALMRVFRGEVTRLIINIPPRYSKTELVSKFVSFGLGHFPDAEFMYLSYSITLAADKTADILQDVRSAAYREIFPMVDLTKDAEGHWKTTRRGAVYAAGTEGTITGFGAGKMRAGFGGAMIVDDPLKPDDAFSDTVRDRVWRTFQNTLENRLNWATTPIIFIMQRLHEQDPAGRLLAGENGEKWEELILPAIQTDGSALWPEKHSLEVLHRMQEKDAYTFSGQYLQRPVPLGGGFFTEKMLLAEQPRILMDEPAVYRPVAMPPFCDGVYAIVDSAVKSGKHNDGVGVMYFALAVYGQLPQPLVVLDYDYGQMDAVFLKNWLPGVIKRLEELAKLCKARQGNRGVWVEDKASGSELIQWSQGQGMLVHAIDSSQTALGKAERAVAISPYVSGNQVKFTQAAWDKVVTYKGRTRNHATAQILAFSPTVADQGEDDLLDCFTYGVYEGMKGVKR